MTMPTPSIQLYSVTNLLDVDPDGTLAQLTRIGFDTVEAFDFVRRPRQLAAALDRHQLQARTGHAALVSTVLYALDGSTTPAPSWDETFDAARQLGIEIVIDPYVPPAQWATLDQIQATAGRLNAAAEAAARHGLLVGYHNHDHELRATAGDRPGLEVLADHLDPAVRLEVDLYWAAAAGADVVDLVSKLGERVLAVHVKDGPLGHHIVTGVPPVDQTPAGQGDVPLAGALQVGAALEYTVVEFDGYQGDIFQAIAESYAFVTHHAPSRESATPRTA